VYLDYPATCIDRVRQRVRRGGHHVPDDDVRRRFAHSCDHFWHIYRKFADYWYVIYNSSGDFKRIASGEPNITSILDAKAFGEFQQLVEGSET
jgi:predicted ABC-type ATPase